MRSPPKSSAPDPVTPPCAPNVVDMTDFVCPNGHTFSARRDKDGLIDGYGNPPCPECGKNAAEANDYGDWECPEGHTWRTYGNGGLVFGMVPRCPEHDVLPLN